MGRSKIGSFGTDFDSPNWLSLDPCGILCVTFSFSLHVFAVVAIILTCLSNSLPAKIIFGACYVPAALMALWSLFMATTTDPGAVPMGARPLPSNLASESDSVVTERDPSRGGLRRRRGIRRCRKCNDNYKPARAHHDSVTGRCVVKMDHYCPWVGNAVGIMNHKFFILFILYTFLSAILSGVLILIKIIRCKYYSPQVGSTPVGCGLDPTNTGVLFALVVITIMFFCFTCCMLLEQSEAVSTNMSKIARMKTRAGLVGAGEYAPVATEFNEVFGTPGPTWRWLVPTPVRFPEWAADNVLGYDWDACYPCAPYQEPADTDGDSMSSGTSGRSGVSSRVSVEGGDGQLIDSSVTALGPPRDVEAGGNLTTLDQEPLEQELLMEDRSEQSAVKKRSPPSLT